MISATDPVSVLSTFKEIKADENLFAMIFGESILNDAVTLTLYRTLLSYSKIQSISISSVTLSFLILMSSSCFQGVFFGLLGSYILKKINPIYPNHVNHEITVMVVLPWVSFLAADVDYSIILESWTFWDCFYHVLRVYDGPLLYY